MKKVFFILFLTTAFAAAQAQQGDLTKKEDSIKAVINQFFEGLNKGDTSILLKTVADSIVLQTVTMNRRNGQIMVRNEPLSDLLMGVAKRPPEIKSLEERIVFESIKTDGPLAAVWTPYKFFVNEKLSHCGANSFTLVRLAAGWKITGIIDTRRRQGCE